MASAYTGGPELWWQNDATMLREEEIAGGLRGTSVPVTTRCSPVIGSIVDCPTYCGGDKAGKDCL